MKTQLYSYLILLFGLLAACQQNAPSDLFRRIEDCMETYPDSALMLLDQTPHPERLSGKQRADYALLLTQARDKNFLDSLQSDSLIKIAVDYYKDSKDDIKIGKTLFYYGRVMMMQDNDTVAIQAFLDAQTRLENTKEFKMLGLIKEYIGYLNDNRGLQDVALANYRQSVDLYLKAKDTLGAIYAYRNMAWIFKKQQLRDSALIYLNEGINLLKGDTTSLVLPSLLQLQGICEGENKDYSNAINHLLSAIKYEKDLSSVPQYYFALGDIYMHIELYDEAKTCFKQGLLSKDIYTQAGAYHFLYSLEKKRKNDNKAITYMEKSDSLFRIYQKEKAIEDIITIQHKHEKTVFFIKTELIKQKKQNQIQMWMSLFFLLLIFYFLSYHWIKKQFKSIYKKHTEKYIMKIRKIIEQNKQIAKQHSSSLEILKQEIQEENNTRIEKLNQRILNLQNENKKICAKKEGFLVLEELKSNKLIVSEMNSQEIISLFEYIDLILNHFATRLREEYKLNEETILFTICIRLNFSTEQLAFIFDCLSTAIYKRKYRLKNSLHLGKKDDLDTFLSFFPPKMS